MDDLFTMMFLIVGILFVFGIMLIINYSIANEFSRIAEDKGYEDRKYFWFCFFFGIVGYLMVVALPDCYNEWEEEVHTYNNSKPVYNNGNGVYNRQTAVPPVDSEVHSRPATVPPVEEKVYNKPTAVPTKENGVKYCPGCGTVQSAEQEVCYKCGKHFHK